jgi:multicomponent K+:H+ antiporter subunit E
MRRLFPAPLLSVALLLLWLLLNLSLSAGQVLLGIFFGVLAPLLMAPLRPSHPHIRRPLRVLELLGRVGIDLLVSNVKVGWQVWNLGRRPPRSAFVKVPLELRDPAGLATLSIVCTVIPGTVWSELALDRSLLLIHVFDLDDEVRFIAHFKATYERPLMEIFQ